MAEVEIVAACDEDGEYTFWYEVDGDKEEIVAIMSKVIKDIAEQQFQILGGDVEDAS